MPRGTQRVGHPYRSLTPRSLVNAVASCISATKPDTVSFHISPSFETKIICDQIFESNAMPQVVKKNENKDEMSLSKNSLNETHCGQKFKSICSSS